MDGYRLHHRTFFYTETEIRAENAIQQNFKGIRAWHGRSKLLEGVLTQVRRLYFMEQRLNEVFANLIRSLMLREKHSRIL